MAEKQVTVRVKVAGDRVTQTFRLYGAEGEKALSRISAAARVQGRALERNAGQFRRTQAAGAAFGGGMRNVSLQLSQVAQQASATGDWMRALAIQLPDLALGFGTIGIAIGALAGVALPLLAERIMGGSTSAKTMQDRVSELEAATTAYRRAAENAAMPTAKLREEFGTAAEAARQFFTVQRDFARLDMMTALRDMRRELANVYGDLTGISEAGAMAFTGALDRLAELQRPRLNEQGIDIRSAEEINAALAAMEREGDGLQRIISQVGPAVRRVQEELHLSEQAASDFVAALVRVRDAENLDARIAAMQGLVQEYYDAASANGELSEAQGETLSNLLSTLEAMIQFKAISEAATGTVDATAAAATRLADEVNRAAGAAVNFVANLGQANLAGIRAEVAALESGADKISAQLERRRAEIWADPNFQRALNSPIPDIREEALAGRSRDLAQLEEELRLIERKNAAYAAMSQSTSGAATSTQQLTAAQRMANQVLGEAQQAAVTYADVVAVLDEKLRSGEISQEAYAEALERVRARMDDLGGATDQVNQRFGDLVAGVLTGAQEMDRVLAQLGQRLLSLAFNGLFDIIGLGSVGGLFGFAEGTHAAPGGYAVVGERGPELMQVPRGARVIPAGRTRALMSAAGLPGFAEGTPGAPGGAAWVGERGAELMRLPRAAQAAPPGGRSMIDLNIRMEEGSFVADVQRISGDVSVRTTQAMLQSYDRSTLPRSVQRIQADPRRRG